MGGCRCSYKNCERATKNSEKDFHFFHYPVRDPDRCLKWISNARKPSFLNLPEDQLRNKVICQNHFEHHYFTNANRKRLIYNAVPTLDVDCSDPKDDGMCNVQVLQTNADASVFTVDTNLLNIKEVNEVRSFLIENGDVVPANLNQIQIVVEQPPVIQEVVRLHSYINPNEISNNNEYKIEELNETVHRSELLIKCEPECIKEAVTISNNHVLTSVDNSSSTEPVVNLTKETKKVKVKLPVVKNRSTDFEILSKAVEEHTREIAALKRLLNLKIQRVKLQKQKEKMYILGKLRRLLPPTLLALVNLHLYAKQDHFSKVEKQLLTTLFTASPSTYDVLINDCNWKLPSSTIVKKLTNDINSIR